MPSVFEQLMVAGALDPLYAVHGVAAVYTAPDGMTADVTLRRHPEMFRADVSSARASRDVQTGEILVRVSELAAMGGAGGCVKGGRFTIAADSQVWTIENVPLKKNGQWHCQVSRQGTERLMPRGAAKT